METLRFGIIQVGQIWCVIGAERLRLGFTSREKAVEAAEAIASKYRNRGGDCDILMQDEVGRLVSLGAAS